MIHLFGNFTIHKDSYYESKRPYSNLWGGGLSTVVTVKGLSKITGKTKYKVEKVQKLVQSLHNFSAYTIATWLVTPTSNHWTNKKDWLKKSERERIFSHLEDYIHDQFKSGLMLSWYVE